jgi:outer membrane lipoprotein LolB
MVRIAAVCALGLLLYGCARLPPAEPVAWQAHRAAMAALEDWRLEAKIGYRTPQDGGSVRLDWVQRGARSEVGLRGPFGAGSALLEIEPGEAVLRQPGARERRAASAETLSRELLGWPLPARELRDWVRGIPYRDAPVEALILDPQGRLQELRQHGWVLRFADYRGTEAGHLPGRIDADDGRLRIRMVIKRWYFEPR